MSMVELPCLDMNSPSATPGLFEELSPQTLMRAASEETGLNNFGSDFLEPLTMLVQSAAQETKFSPIGLMAFKADLHRMLVNRLRFEEDLRLHPEILDEDISDPIIILGLVRTGTSKLQRMMSADPHVQALYFWRVFNPAQFPNADSDPFAPDPRIEVTRQACAMLQALSPDYMAAHPTLAEDVEEELLLLMFTFENIVHYFTTPAPSYYQWVVKRDLHGSYRYLGCLMRYLQWQDGGKKGRPWIMKSPLHLGNLDALLEVFPKATLVHCHRDVADVIASFCKLIEAGWRLKTDAIDLRELGRSVVEVWATEMNKYLTLRKQLGSRVDIYDVPYARIESDPMPIIRELHRRAGRTLSEDSVQALLKWSAENPKDRFGKNIYTLERYGLTRESVERAFGDYIKQFGGFYA
jgi:Sulfotransferase family